MPFCENKEIKSKHFLKKFHRFTKDRFEVAIKWKTRQVKTLFPLNNGSIHPSCVIYKGTCSCGKTYTGETIRNAPMTLPKSQRLLKYKKQILSCVWLDNFM